MSNFFFLPSKEQPHLKDYWLNVLPAAFTKTSRYGHTVHGMVCYILCYVKVWLYEIVWYGRYGMLHNLLCKDMVVWSGMVWYGMVCYILCYVKVWLYEVVWCGMLCYGMLHTLLCKGMVVWNGDVVWYAMLYTLLCKGMVVWSGMWYGMLCYILCYVKVRLYEVVWCGMMWYGMVCSLTYNTVWYTTLLCKGVGVWNGMMWGVVWYGILRALPWHAIRYGTLLCYVKV